MSFPVNIILTLAVGGMFGLLCMRFRIPNGLRFGSLLGVALLSIIFNAAYVPSQARLIIQAVAGAIVGCTIERSDLKRLPKVLKPTLITLGMFLLLTLSVGNIVHALSPIDLLTSLLSVVPGGVTDIPIIASGMGADTPKVALAQLSRYILGVTVFPPMILAYDTLVQKGKSASNTAGVTKETVERKKSTVRSLPALVCTLALAFAAGMLGSFVGIPAGVFLFSVIAVMFLKLTFDFAYIAPAVKRVTMVISGCYIGSLITMDDVIGFRFLALPILIILVGYIANSFITGKLLSLTCGFTRKEGMLITTPAGVADIALNSAEIGVQNTDIIIIQVFRAVVAAGIFPQIISALIWFYQ